MEEELHDPSSGLVGQNSSLTLILESWSFIGLFTLLVLKGFVFRKASEIGSDELINSDLGLGKIYQNNSLSFILPPQ